MSAKVYYDDDADLSLIQERSVAVLGGGGQSHAQALCLRDSGIDVVVGLADDAPTLAQARDEGLRVTTPPEASAAADLVVVLAPEAAQPVLYTKAIAPHLAAGKGLIFGHGFAVRYGFVEPPHGVDVAVVAPTGPADLVRRQYVDGKGMPVLVGVEQDASGEALALALSYAKAIGGTRAGAIRTTVGEATEAALFGGQAVLGGLVALVHNGFEVLTEAGYGPEIAYLTCLHQLKAVVDRMYVDGPARMAAALSDTGEYGAHSRGPRLIDARVTEEMRRILAEIRSGEFALEFASEEAAGHPTLARWRAGSAAHPIEDSGRDVRAMMPGPRTDIAGLDRG